MQVMVGSGFKIAVNAAALALVSLTLGCASHGERLGLARQAELPRKVQPYPQIQETLRCMGSTGVLKHTTFVVGAFADSTGKINQVATGATGAFVPQGGSASYVTDAIRTAGGQVVSTYFGAPRRPVPAQYAINGIFNSLDFGQQLGADLRIDGIGPIAAAGFAQLSLSIQLDQADTRLNRQMSLIQRPVRFTELGVGTGRVFHHTLVTGTAVVASQERLQLEALNGPIGLGVADVLMKEFPILRERCGSMVADLLRLEAPRPPREPRLPK
jgi:hypothetical protein